MANEGALSISPPADAGAIISVVSTTRLVLLIFGTGFEAIGIGLVLAPDLLPYGRSLSTWLRRRWLAARAAGARIAARVRRLIGRPETVYASAGGVSAGAFTGGARGVVSAPSDASLEEQVKYLLSRDEIAQAKFDELAGLERRVSTIESERFASFRRDIKEFVADALAAAEARYRPLRVLGGFALAVGVVCLTFASFVT